MAAKLDHCPLCGKAPFDWDAGNRQGPMVKKGRVSDFGYCGNRTCWIVECVGCCTTCPHHSEDAAIVAFNERPVEKRLREIIARMMKAARVPATESVPALNDVYEIGKSATALPVQET